MAPVVTSLLFQDAPLEVRQMAGVLLKQFAENSWQECPHTASKDVVKANILPGLGDSPVSYTHLTLPTIYSV